MARKRNKPVQYDLTTPTEALLRNIPPPPKAAAKKAPGDELPPFQGDEKPPKGPPSQSTTLDALLKVAPGYRKYLSQTKLAAARWKVSPEDLLAVLAWENGKANPNAVSTAGAAGLAQILDRTVDKSLNPDQYSTFTAEFGSDITPEKARDPRFAINYLAWRMSYGVRQYGSLDDWYRGQGGNGRPRGYNPGYQGDPRGAGPSALYGKAGVANAQPTYPQGPVESAGSAVDTSAAKAGIKQQIYDKWVVRNPNGTLGFAKIAGANPPKNAVIAQGQPLLRSDLQRNKQQLDDTYYAYLGRPATDREIANVLEHGISQYALTASLAKKPQFMSSPIWKQHAAGIVSYGKQAFGDSWKPDNNLIRRAIVENWDGATLQQNLKQRPEYVKGPVYLRDRAALTNVFQTIYGVPGDNAKTIIGEAALDGWSTDQFAGWLRSQPAYTSSPEYQAKSLQFLDAMGLLTGGQAVLEPGQLPKNNQPGGFGKIPNSKLVPRKPGPLAARNDLKAVLTDATTA